MPRKRMARQLTKTRTNQKGLLLVRRDYLCGDYSGFGVRAGVHFALVGMMALDFALWSPFLGETCGRSFGLFHN